MLAVSLKQISTEHSQQLPRTLPPPTGNVVSVSQMQAQGTRSKHTHIALLRTLPPPMGSVVSAFLKHCSKPRNLMMDTFTLGWKRRPPLGAAAAAAAATAAAIKDEDPSGEGEGNHC
jgi:hypothetical protein